MRRRSFLGVAGCLSASVLVGTLAVSSLALAQAPTPAPGTAAEAQQSRAQAFIARFEAANTTHDVHLTLAQVQVGHMRMIARHFSAIDKDGKGYVTLSDIQGWRQARSAQRHATQGSTPG